MRLYETTRNTLAALALLAAPATAWAQPAPTPEEVQQAQVRWNEGKAYFDAGNFEAARVAFKQAYTVFPHATFLQNLGEAELRTGRPVEAARHFTAFLRASSSGSPGQRELAKKSLARASQGLGSIVVTTNVDDAEIRVDDEVVGRSPLGSLTWYVEPGRHLVTARKDGYLDGSERVEITTGPPRTVSVRVQRVVGGTSESPQEEPKPAGAPAIASRAAHSVSAPASSTAAPTAESRRSGLPARTIVLLGGAALTVGAVVVGTIYAVRASSDASKIRDAEDKYPNERGSFCHDPLATGRVDICANFNSDVMRERTDRQVRDIALVSAGVLGVATLATVFIWRPRQATVSFAPSLLPASPGLVVFGNF